VHLSPVGRNSVGKRLPWAAQAILNPLGVGFCSKFTWEVAAKTTTWVPDWPKGSRIHDDSWVIEFAVPRESLDLQSPNKAGQPWSVLLARNWKRTGWNQSALPHPLRDLGLFPEVRSEYIEGGVLPGTQGRADFDAWNGTLSTRIKPHDFALLQIRTYKN
jgi:hypothetical protein